MTSEDNAKMAMGDTVTGASVEDDGTSSASAVDGNTVTSTSSEKKGRDAPCEDGNDGNLSAKRPRIAASDKSEDDSRTDNSSNENDEDGSPLDLANIFGHKAGDRFEVHWEISNDDDDRPTISHWWGATLLEFDGRTEDSVAIRVLDYDPFPEGGFPERSKEDVIFMTPELLVSPDDSQTHLEYRREGDTERNEKDIVWYNEGDLNEQLNGILMNALNKNKQAWNNLPPARQAALAEVIAKKKEKLMEVLKNQSAIITSESIGEILQQAFG